MTKIALIVAGGVGTRMGTAIPKQFLSLAGKPILMHTLQQFSTEVDQLVLVLPENQIAYWQNLCLKFDFKLPVLLVLGGKSRFESVRNGLSPIVGNGIVAVHDAVRPFVSSQIIKDAFEMASLKGNAVVSVSLHDSIREVKDGRNKSVDRSLYRLIQTPQCFDLDFLKKAYQQPELSFFTDDASVAESVGCEIFLTQGSYDNIKITTPEDLVIGEAILKKNSTML
jgi:2-C-methyl-D-erythritol 4-phosphate cytidylyltransferase